MAREKVKPQNRMRIILGVFICGVLCASCVPKHGNTAVILSFLLMCAMYAAALWGGSKAAAFLALVFAIGFGRTVAAEFPARTDLSTFPPGNSVVLRVRNDPILTDTGYMICECDAVRLVRGQEEYKVTGGVKVSGKDIILRYGDVFMTNAPVRGLSKVRNPGVLSEYERGVRKGIRSKVYISPKNTCDVIGAGGNPIKRLSYFAKHRIMTSIEAMHPGPAGDLIEGITLGTYSSLSREITDDFARDGTSHILAASGFNCAVLWYAVIFLVAIVFGKPKQAWIVTIFALIVYVFIVGGSSSVIRAFAMLALYLCAKPLKRIAIPENILLSAVLIILLCNPHLLFDVGMLLSVACVAALFFAGPFVLALSEKRDFNPSHIGKFGRTSVASSLFVLWVTIFTAPIMMYIFNRFPLMSVPANMVVSITAPILLIIGLIDPLVMGVPLVSMFVAFIGDIVADATLLITEIFSFVPDMTVPTPPLWLVFIMYGAIFWGAAYVNNKYIDPERP